MSKRAACYCRVSTKKDEQLDSLDKQKEFFTNFFASNPAYELQSLYADEGISAKSMRNRKEFLRMLKDAQEGKFDVVFVKDVSRFARNVKDFYQALSILEDAHVRVNFVTMGLRTEEASRFSLGLMALLAEDESERLSVKVKFGKNVTAGKGRVPNFVFGYDRIDTYTLVPNQEEAQWVLRIFTLYTSQGWGTARIASYLNDMNVCSKRGSYHSWTQNTVCQLLKNPLYIGKVANKKSEVVNFRTGQRTQYQKQRWVVVEREEFRILEQKLYDHAQRLLVERANSFVKGHRQSSVHPMSNLLRCGQDLRSFRRIGGGKTPRWVCSVRNARGIAACPNDIRIEESWIEATVCDVLRYAFYAQAGSMQRVVERVRVLLKEQGEQPRIDQKIMEDTKKRYLDLYAHGLLTIKEAEDAIAPIHLAMEEASCKVMAQKKETMPCMELHNMATLYIEQQENNGLLENVFLKSIIDRIEILPKGGVVMQLTTGGQIQLKQNFIE